MYKIGIIPPNLEFYVDTMEMVCKDLNKQFILMQQDLYRGVLNVHLPSETYIDAETISTVTSFSNTKFQLTGGNDVYCIENKINSC